jgi:hypothetical protein
MQRRPGATSPPAVRPLSSTGKGLSCCRDLTFGSQGWLSEAGRVRTDQEDRQSIAVAAELKVLADQLIQKELVVIQSRPDVVLRVWTVVRAQRSASARKDTGAWLAAYRLIHRREDFGLHTRSHIAEHALGLERVT